jgi:hypothetical protein
MRAKLLSSIKPALVTAAVAGALAGICIDFSVPFVAVAFIVAGAARLWAGIVITNEGPAKPTAKLLGVVVAIKGAFCAFVAANRRGRCVRARMFVMGFVACLYTMAFLGFGKRPLAVVAAADGARIHGAGAWLGDRHSGLTHRNTSFSVVGPLQA